jgi:hypothetical protein
MTSNRFRPDAVAARASPVRRTRPADTEEPGPGWPSGGRPKAVVNPSFCCVREEEKNDHR